MLNRDLRDLYGMVYPEMAKMANPNPKAHGVAVTMTQGKTEAGRYRTLVLMVVDTDDPLTDSISQYVGRIELDADTKRDRQDLEGMGASGILKTPIWREPA